MNEILRIPLYTTVNAIINSNVVRNYSNNLRCRKYEPKVLKITRIYGLGMKMVWVIMCLWTSPDQSINTNKIIGKFGCLIFRFYPRKVIIKGFNNYI